MHPTNIKVKKLSESEIEIAGEIPAGQFEAFRARAIKGIQAGLELPGFRKGHVPTKTIEERLGARVLEEMAELAFHAAYPEILEQEKIDAIDRPRIHITKLAPGNALEFKIYQTIMPEIDLPDYKKIASEVPKTSDVEGPQTSEVSREQRWIKIAEALLSETKVPVPPVLVEKQVEIFLSHAKREGPEARAAIRPEAEKYVRLQLLLSAIGKKENLPLPAVVEMLENIKV